jgi:hypothetical protein
MIAQWFHAEENWISGESAVIAQNRDFISLLADPKVYLDDWTSGDIHIHTLNTDLDGVPHSMLMCSYKVFNMKDELTDLAEFITEAELDNDIYDAFTYEDYVILTLAAYDYRTDMEKVNA